MNTFIPKDGFPKRKGIKIDLIAIAYWVSTGFFLEDDTFWEDVKWEGPNLYDSKWLYDPRNISLEETVEEFKEIFESIIKEEIKDKRPLLALSGGLDSRTLAVALKNLNINPHTYSYKFSGSFDETKYGKEIAYRYRWTFDDLVIPKGYLWDILESLGSINGCFAEFTHARQAAVVEELSKKGDVWLLGHWGDVLFDDMGISSGLKLNDQINVIQQKIIKKGGKELATDLWNIWKLPDNFENHLNRRIRTMHERISIDNANARIRAFKSMYWATRWTSTNLAYFEHFKPMVLPYYDDRMCEFIMTVPEKWLAGRQIQIEYIKKYAPELAAIPWQSKSPYNLFNYDKHFTAYHFPYRVAKKIKHTTKTLITGKRLVQRNWEIQFLGKENNENLERWLFDNPALNNLVSKEIVHKYYDLFKSGDQVYWSHPISMLLTLSVFAKNNLS